MKREPIKTLPYEEVNFLWISSHWDVHLNGICLYQDKVCEFKNDGWELYDEETDETIPMIVDIYELSMLEKLKWLYRKRKFEICVGYHWTYPRERQGFYYRRPRWLYKLLFRYHYGSKRFYSFLSGIIAKALPTRKD